MAILYTIDSMTVSADEFKSRISKTGYFDFPQKQKTWVHIASDYQIIMAKEMTDENGQEHTFRIAIDK